MRSAQLLTVFVAMACRREFTAPPTPPTTPLVISGAGQVSAVQGYYYVAFSLSAGTITADGTYPYEAVCDRNFVFSGYLTKERWIALQVRDTTSYGQGNNCQATPRFWSYHAVVGSLAPGSYVVDVQYPDLNGNFASFETDTVVVP
jgi:hypothetical protein